jgi:hypothetical protein
MTGLIWVVWFEGAKRVVCAHISPEGALACADEHHGEVIRIGQPDNVIPGTGGAT